MGEYKMRGHILAGGIAAAMFATAGHASMAPAVMPRETPRVAHPVRSREQKKKQGRRMAHAHRIATTDRSTKLGRRLAARRRLGQQGLF